MTHPPTPATTPLALKSLETLCKVAHDDDCALMAEGCHPEARCDCCLQYALADIRCALSALPVPPVAMSGEVVAAIAHLGDLYFELGEMSPCPAYITKADEARKAAAALLAMYRPAGESDKAELSAMLTAALDERDSALLNALRWMYFESTATVYTNEDGEVGIGLTFGVPDDLDCLTEAERKVLSEDAPADDAMPSLCARLIDEARGDPELVPFPAAPAGETRALNALAADIAAGNQKWWTGPDGTPLVRNAGELLMLVVSEIVEAFEGERKNLMDDKLPHRRMAEVEIADAIVRLLDYSAARGYDLDGALREKLAFNATRADHKTESAQIAKANPLEFVSVRAALPPSHAGEAK